jgi:hypothetical protein
MPADNKLEVRPTEERPQEERRLKKPAARSRQNSPLPGPNTRTALPASVMNPHSQDLSKMAEDMNSWVMKELGANLQEMEQEKQKAARFKPKVPAKRYQERHPEAAISNTESNDVDMTTGDVSDMEDDDDWVIEEYVRVPAHAMKVNVAPTDVGVLVLDGKEESNLFFGPERDEDDELDEDDEDENGESLNRPWTTPPSVKTFRNKRLTRQTSQPRTTTQQTTQRTRWSRTMNTGAMPMAIATGMHQTTRSLITKTLTTKATMTWYSMSTTTTIPPWLVSGPM